MTSFGEKEQKDFEMLERLLESPRYRDVYAVDHLTSLLQRAATSYPLDYRTKWLDRLSQQPERFWEGALPRCTSLKSLRRFYALVPCARLALTLYDVTDQEVERLVRLPCATSLFSLILRGKSLTMSSVHAVCSSKSRLGGLREFNLKGAPEHLGDACARVLSETSMFEALESLNLMYNGISEEGVLMFAASTHYRKLKRLELVRPDLFTEVGLHAMIDSAYLSGEVQDYHFDWLVHYFS